MRNSSIARFIVRSRRIWRDIVFRGFAILSLTLLAIWHPWNYPDKIQEPTSQQSSEDNRRESADERIAEYTLGLDALTALLALSTLGLWIVTWSGLKAQAKDMRRSLRISASTAEAAKVAADAAMLSVSSERAWMCFEGVKYQHHTDLIVGGIHYGDALGIQVAWKNKGRSPAMKCETVILWSQVLWGPPLFRRLSSRPPRGTRTGAC
jgi:hypothetical protein